MFTKIKDGYNNLRRHKIMVMLIILLGFACYSLFVRNYKFVSPITSIHKETYLDVWNDRALCNTELEFYKKQTTGYNEQALKELENN